MNKNGPVIVIDDDEDDLGFFKKAFQNLHLSNPLVGFDNAETAFQYLARPEVRPFLIICDINMPGLNGLELRDMLFQDPALKEKAIPFLFFTTAANRETVKEAYRLPIQGVFQKPESSKALERRISLMIAYWEDSLLL